MQIQFLGATRTTTGSMYLLTVNGQRILLECGLFQGRRGESIERNQTFPFDPRQVDVAILSHAHIDHCGNLPNLHKQGFRETSTAPSPRGISPRSCCPTRPTSSSPTPSS